MSTFDMDAFLRSLKGHMGAADEIASLAFLAKTFKQVPRPSEMPQGYLTGRSILID